MAEQKTETVKAPKGAPDGTPLSVTTFSGEKPGKDVSNADVDLARVSLDAAFSKNVVNPDPNPNDDVPAPGPSSVEVHGLPTSSDEPANYGGEAGR
jgi:hypothetical protein